MSLVGTYILIYFIGLLEVKVTVYSVLPITLYIYEGIDG